MAFAADYAVLYDRLDEELRLAPAPTPNLFAKIVVGTCSRIPALSKSVRIARIGRLVEAGAWTDCALALIELELPAWKLRRLAFDSGEWICSLSRQLNYPATLDDTADAAHEIMPFAILRALVQARRMAAASPPAMTAVPAIAPAADETICCDNFS
jgi:hypothetical protein